MRLLASVKIAPKITLFPLLVTLVTASFNATLNLLIVLLLLASVHVMNTTPAPIAKPAPRSVHILVLLTRQLARAPALATGMVCFAQIVPSLVGLLAPSILISVNANAVPITLPLRTTKVALVGLAVIMVEL